MWKFSAIEDKHFKGFLWNGKLDDVLNEVLKEFHTLSPLKQFEFWHYVKEKGKYLDIKTLQSVFGIDYKDAKSILTNPYRIVRIPLAGEGKGKIVRAVLIKDLEKTITNAEHLREPLDTIRRFLGKGFAVFFEEDFLGESFMLPVTVGLYVENIPEELLFTGKIDKEGYVYDVNAIEEKRKLAIENGMRLVEPVYINNVKEIKEWLDAESYHIPFYITNTTDQFEGEFKNFLNSTEIEDTEKVLRMLKVFNGINEDDLMLITGRIEPNMEVWERLVLEFLKKIKRISNSLRDKEILHIAIKGSSAFAFACGIAFGSQKPFYFYHFQNGMYYPVKVDNVRYLKERCKEYRQVEYKYEDRSDKLAIIISMASHEAEGDVLDFLKDKNMSHLIIRHKRSGNIPVEDIKETVKEASSIIQNIRKERSFKEYHFFFSCPVAVAFMLGISFGHYNPGSIYNYEKEGYKKVLNIEIIRKLKEGDINKG